MNHNLKVLLVESDANDVQHISNGLSHHSNPSFYLRVCNSIAEASELLINHEIDIVLTDFNLPDGSGLELIERLRSISPDLPIIVLTNVEDEQIAVRAVQAGAQDYIVKGEFNYPLARAILYAIERSRLQSYLLSLSITDDLTGLLNRRGFWNLAEQQLKIAHRRRERVVVLFIDIDGFKTINDTFGHREGDKALIDLSRLLKNSFRESDIIGRIGGDEFVVFAIDCCQQHADCLVNRLNENLRTFNAEGRSSFTLSVSVGQLVSDPENFVTIEELLEQADHLMYTQKKHRMELSA